jgi:glucose-1-phosphate thymidylyltransferase
MKIIIPMAGIGKRMRPHTLTTPKPLLPVMGKPIVEILISDIASIFGGKIEEVVYISGSFGEVVEKRLIKIANECGYPARIYYQEEALGTAHALFCAKESIDGNIFIAFADTLFKTDVKISGDEDAIIWTKQIENPSHFGVVVTDENHYITKIVEKPRTFVSDHAIIGLYYFADGKRLLDEIDYLIKNDIRGNNEYQLTDVIERLRSKGLKIKDYSVEGWFDCGNKNATVQTNQEMLKINFNKDIFYKDVQSDHTVIIDPCYISEGVTLNNSVIGPYVSIGKNTKIENSVISNSIIMDKTIIKHANINNSIIGSHVKYSGRMLSLSIGDFSESEL